MQPYIYIRHRWIPSLRGVATKEKNWIRIIIYIYIETPIVLLIVVTLTKIIGVLIIGSKVTTDSFTKD